MTHDYGHEQVVQALSETMQELSGTER